MLLFRQGVTHHTSGGAERGGWPRDRTAYQRTSPVFGSRRVGRTWRLRHAMPEHEFERADRRAVHHDREQRLRVFLGGEDVDALHAHLDAAVADRIEAGLLGAAEI